MSGSWLSPPVVPIDTNLAWLLRAAFAEDFDGALSAEHPELALQLARKLEVSGRIAQRMALPGRAELNAFERDLDSDFRTNIAVDAQLSQGLQQAVQVAAQHSLPVIALKYAALRLGKISRPGSRVVGDLDLLLSADAAIRLSDALLGVGFTLAGTRSHAHQLEALVGPYGAVVELHLHIPGVHIAGTRFATAADLFNAGLVAPANGSGVLVPAASVLAAHALAHGLLQNRATPQSYSLLRMLSDLIDLRRAQPGALISSAAIYLAPPLSGLCAVAEQLCEALQRGLFAGPGFDGTPAQQLLWHCLATRLNDNYARRLRAAGFADILRGHPTASELVRYLKGSLFPPEPELDAIYGPAASKFAQLRRRWLRPVELSLRVARQWLRSRAEPRRAR